MLDPFAGTGSTGVAAMRSGSFFLGHDSDAEITVLHTGTHAYTIQLTACTIYNVP